MKTSAKPVLKAAAPKSELPDIPKLKRLFSLTVEFPQPRSRSNPGITLRSRLPKPKRKSR